MNDKEQLISPHVETLGQNQFWITNALGEWFQSYDTTIAFKGEFGVIINKEWYEGKQTTTTSKWLGQWLSHVEKDVELPPGAGATVPWKSHIKSGYYKLMTLSNYRRPPKWVTS